MNDQDARAPREDANRKAPQDPPPPEPPRAIRVKSGLRAGITIPALDAKGKEPG